MAGEYYRTLNPGERSRHVLGQIFWIPAYERMEDYHVVRPGPWDRTQPITTALFSIEKKSISTIGHSTNLFQHMPLPELKILADEELIVKKVKRRPGVLVIREGVSPRRLANVLAGILPRKPNPDCHVFAPVVSLRKEGNVGRDYPDGFIDKVKAGDLPEFIYLPPDGTVLKNESMALLTQLQVHGERFVEETPLALEQCSFGAALETFWQDLEGQVLVEGDH
jgi:hypothetical protein